MISGNISGTAGLLVVDCSTDAWDWIVVIPHIEPQPLGVDLPVAPEKDSTAERNKAAIEHTVKDEFGIRRDNIATLTDTPADGVEHP